MVITFHDGDGLIDGAPRSMIEPILLTIIHMEYEIEETHLIRISIREQVFETIISGSNIYAKFGAEFGIMLL